MTAIYKRELKSYFCSVTGYMFCAFMLLFAGIYTMAVNINSAYANFEYVLSNMSFIFIIIIPVLTMRVISEERKQRTDTLLYSLPVSMTKVVVSKYLAMLTVLAVPVLVMGLYPLVLSLFGKVNFLSAYSALVGFFLLGAGLISMGLFASSLTENQALSAGIAFLIVLINYFITSFAYYLSSTAAASLIALAIMVLALVVIVYVLTKEFSLSASVAIIGEGILFFVYYAFPEKLEGLFPAIIEKLSLFERFNIFTQGIFDISSVIYLVAVSAVFVFLTVQSMEKRRWS
ncbi:MAG: ABC transporter permease subunit [Clostridia bacterium]|nr:ABC transporter permease subunit [Clostridia bacterium]